jgi:hypothetical protein
LGFTSFDELANLKNYPVGRDQYKYPEMSCGRGEARIKVQKFYEKFSLAKNIKLPVGVEPKYPSYPGNAKSAGGTKPKATGGKRKAADSGSDSEDSQATPNENNEGSVDQGCQEGKENMKGLMGKLKANSIVKRSTSKADQGRIPGRH